VCFVGWEAQDEPSTGVILFDTPSVGNWNAKRTEPKDGATAGDLGDAEARLDAPTAAVAPWDPSAHRDTNTAAPEQRQEPERGRPLVVLGDPGYEVDPSVAGAGQLHHVGHNWREFVVDAELQSLDLSSLASHARSIAVAVVESASCAADNASDVPSDQDFLEWTGLAWMGGADDGIRTRDPHLGNT